MSSQPPPGSTGRSPRTPALGSTGGSPWTPAPFHPVPGSTGGISQIPAALSAQAAPRGSRRYTILVDWCLERVEGEEGKIRVAGTTYTPQMSPQMRKGASISTGNRKMAGRVFRSSAIVKRHDFNTIESEDGYLIRMACVLNIPKTRENGFSKEVIAMIGLQGLEFWKVCECFVFGFPIPWQRLVNPTMVLDNEHARQPSETTTSAPSHSVEDFMAMFLSDSFSSSIRYDFTVEDHMAMFISGKTDGLATQSLSNLTNDNAGHITASWGLYGLRVDVPEKPLAPCAEACNSGQESYQHESTQIDASKQEIVNRSISSVSVKQSTGTISSISKVDGNTLAPSKVSSVVNEGYRSTVGCGQAEEDADIQQEKMLSCSSELGMVALPTGCTSSQLGEPGIPKSGKDSVNLGTTDALELPTKGMTPKFGAIGGPENCTGRRLRSGKYLGMPSGGPMKKGHRQKKILQASSVDQGATSTADLTSHENDFSAAEVVVKERMESHDPCRKGPGRPAKGKEKGKRKRKRKRDSAGLFSNWV